LRLFFAVELAPAVRAAASAAGRRLARALDDAGGLDVRWIPEDNLHVTLRFLGEVDASRLGALHEVAIAPCGVTPFTIRVGGFGMFPPSGAPRVIWMGIMSGADGLRALHADLSARLLPLGFEPERRAFSPHVTMARFRQRPPRGAWQVARRAVAAQAVDAGAAPVEAVTLFRSRLSPRGAAYESVLRVPLGG
jgi:RNA 2',3'-cyclic 3'-phosphodiesterase